MQGVGVSGLRSNYTGNKMKIVKVSIELTIDDENEDFYLPGEKDIQKSYPGLFTPQFDKEKIANYLNNKLYEDPEFFGDFGPENIVEVKDFD